MTSIRFMTCTLCSMKHIPLRIALLALALLLVAPSAPAPESAGPLIIAGGGPTDSIHGATLALLGASPAVVVIPHASSHPMRGVSAVEMWLAAGAARATLLDPLDHEGAKERLGAADLIWFSGGSQKALFKAVEAAGLAETLRALHAGGTAIGGTSAGAAIMSKLMISGKPKPESLRSGAMRALRGLEFWPAAIVDQHFVERSRESRLLTAVLDHPELLGVGVSESTAVIVRGPLLHVVGEGQVLVYDARDASVAKFEAGEHQAGRGIILHVLRAGDELRWRR
jgi:cyanophycinase